VTLRCVIEDFVMGSPVGVTVVLRHCPECVTFVLRRVTLAFCSVRVTLWLRRVTLRTMTPLMRIAARMFFHGDTLSVT
jgi:hypothetical protein